MAPILAAPVANFTDLLLDAVCMVDISGRFVFVSAASERIFGYTQQEMIGKAMIDFVAPADRARTLAAAQNIMNGKSHINFENRYLRKDGSIVHIMWSARWSEPDQLRVAVARDVTAIKQARRCRRCSTPSPWPPMRAMTWQTSFSAATQSSSSCCLPPVLASLCSTRPASACNLPIMRTMARRTTHT